MNCKTLEKLHRRTQTERTTEIFFVLCSLASTIEFNFVQPLKIIRNTMIVLYLSLLAFLLAGAGFLHLLPRLGKIGGNISDWFCYAPGIDLAILYFMILPLIIGIVLEGWAGIAIGIIAEISAVLIWTVIHELAHRNQREGRNIHQTLSSIVGRWRNHLAVWITALAAPNFWVVRITEIIVYPPLTWLIKLPKYEAKEWINVSRQKFEGLVGYDLIWCLYCDWMTGVWSLGTEMLRNVESFWCPIRFSSEKKCENCKIDFPDVANGWISSNGTMEEVCQLLEAKYNTNQTERSWYGHSCRKGESENS
jgi:hypothetical protein